MNLISNEKQKVEQECSQYHKSKMESKLLGAQIQNLNEKLDCLRSLFEPRENSFINYDCKFNNAAENICMNLKEFGSFKVSNTYPPLCSAKFLENFNNSALLNTISSIAPLNVKNISNNGVLQTNPSNDFKFPQQVYTTVPTLNCSANLTIYIQIDTVDYYGQKRTDGGDPVSILITDPYGRQQRLLTPNQIVDLNKGIFNISFQI